MKLATKSKKLLFFILLIPSIVLAGALACAQDKEQKTPAPPSNSIGQVVWVKGAVQAKLPDGNPRVLKRRDAIYEKDTLMAGPDASGQVVFSDGGLLALRSDSAVRISEYKYNKASADGNKNVIEVVKGGFRTITGAIAKMNPDGYEVKTPVATIGVRGTDFSLVFDKKCDKDSDSKCGLFVKINKGIISVGNSDGSASLSAKSGNKFGRVKFSNKMPATSKKDFGGMFVTDLVLEPATFGGLGTGSGPGGGSSGGSSGSGGGGFCIQ